jgi:hypothetical protein
MWNGGGLALCTLRCLLHLTSCMSRSCDVASILYGVLKCKLACLYVRSLSASPFLKFNCVLRTHRPHGTPPRCETISTWIFYVHPVEWEKDLCGVEHERNHEEGFRRYFTHSTRLRGLLQKELRMGIYKDIDIICIQRRKKR